jgi:amidase
MQVEAFDRPVVAGEPLREAAPFAGVPILIKDNIDVRGLPTRHGSAAIQPAPAAEHDLVTKQFLAQGFTIVGKTRLPEFGFSPSTEFAAEEPTCNPWHTAYSSGASSGGSAALVAAGVVPLAHANDGGGSIRIPASCCGLVGLKPTRGRSVFSASAQQMPIKIVSDGVVSRSVRDTAHVLAHAERFHRARRLAPVGLVEGPSSRRLHIGLVVDSIRGVRACDDTRAVVERTASVLEKLGHHVEPMTQPVPGFFMDDFKLYWGLLAFAVTKLGPRMYEVLDVGRLDGLTLGLAEYYRRRMARTPVSLARLQASSLAYRLAVRRFDAVL